ncbi:MAG TPA: hypothetical protein VF533_13205 [Solirubrobacteraceae bacterium]|jgi:hypothetical protein
MPTFSRGTAHRLRSSLLAAAVVMGVALGLPASGEAVTGHWAAAFGLQGAASSVGAAAVSGANAYIGGTFTSFAGQPPNAYGRIARWDGSGFKRMGTGLNGRVNAIVVLGTKVYAGGDFTAAGSVTASHLAVWNGSAWSSPGAVTTTGGGYSTVTALATDGTSIFVGGQFDHAGTTAARSIAKYTPGAGFEPLGDGVAGTVKALAWSAGTLWAGGSFTKAGSVSTSSFASWDGTGWSGYGTGLTSNSGASAESIAVDPVSGAVYVGGHFGHAGTTAAVGVAKLANGAWESIGDVTTSTGAEPHVYGLAFRNGVLTATGSFAVAGTATASNLATRSAGVWHQAGGGLPSSGAGRVATAYGTGVLIGGDFDGNAAHSPFLGDVGILAGNTWRSLGQGVQAANSTPGTVNALASDGNGGVWATGVFRQNGATPVNNIGHYTAGAWRPLGGGLFLGTSAGAAIGNALAPSGTDLYVCGRFDHAGAASAKNVARWTGSAWRALGNGLSGGDGTCGALATVGGKVYAGGGFSTAGTGEAKGLAVWDPATLKWSALPGNPGFDGSVKALAVLDDRWLLIGGGFSHVIFTGDVASRPMPHLLLLDTQSAANDGSAYSTIGGVDGPIVYSVKTDPAGNVYVGGQFTKAGVGTGGGTGTTANNVAAWSPGAGWRNLGTGTNGIVSAVEPSGTTLYAAGQFTGAGAATAQSVAAYPLDGTANWSPLGSGGLLGTYSGSAYGTGYGFALLGDGANGTWVGGRFVQAGATPAGSFTHWIR